jgi:hypothetical protein
MRQLMRSRKNRAVAVLLSYLTRASRKRPRRRAPKSRDELSPTHLFSRAIIRWAYRSRGALGTGSPCSSGALFGPLLAHCNGNPCRPGTAAIGVMLNVSFVARDP